MAILAGAEVYVAEVNEKVWDAAKKNGAKGVAKSISEFSDVEFDAIIDYAGFGTTTAEAIETVRRGGIVVQVGMGRLEATISTRALILSEVTLIGSQGGTKEDIAGVCTSTLPPASSSPPSPRSASRTSPRASTSSPRARSSGASSRSTEPRRRSTRRVVRFFRIPASIRRKLTTR